MHRIWFVATRAWPWLADAVFDPQLLQLVQQHKTVHILGLPQSFQQSESVPRRTMPRSTIRIRPEPLSITGKPARRETRQLNNSRIPGGAAGKAGPSENV